MLAGGWAADKLQVLVLPAVACLFTGTLQQCIELGRRPSRA